MAQQELNDTAADTQRHGAHTFGRGELGLQLHHGPDRCGHYDTRQGLAALAPCNIRELLGRASREWVQLALGAVPTSQSMRLKTTNIVRGGRRDPIVVNLALQCKCGVGPQDSSHVLECTIAEAVATRRRVLEQAEKSFMKYINGTEPAGAKRANGMWSKMGDTDKVRATLGACPCDTPVLLKQMLAGDSIRFWSGFSEIWRARS